MDREVPDTTAGLDAYNRGEYATAVAAFTEARLAWQQVGDTFAEADALMSLGVTHQRMNNLHDAEGAYKEALGLFTKTGALDGQAKVMGNLATLLEKRGEHEKAEAYLAQAADIFGEQGDYDNEVATLQYLTKLQMNRRSYVDALLSYNRVLSRLEELTPQQKLIQTLSNVFFKIIGVQVPE
jgi:tetratricopeptide (TPR) repeat protein